MPKKEKIFEYWDLNFKELGPLKQGDDWGVEDNECFACGNFMITLNRCHIIPLIDGGTNDVSNLHILCLQCHAESEGIANYWAWLRYKRLNEWKYGREHFELFLKRQGFDFKQECQSPDFNYEEFENRIRTVFKPVKSSKVR